MRERQKEKTQSKNRETTEVDGDHQLPYEPTEQGKGTHNSQNELNMFQFKGKSSNVFNISINYPPNEDEKEDIKRMNTIFLKILLLQILRRMKTNIRKY